MINGSIGSLVPAPTAQPPPPPPPPPPEELLFFALVLLCCCTVTVEVADAEFLTSVAVKVTVVAPTGIVVGASLVTTGAGSTVSVTPTPKKELRVELDFKMPVPEVALTVTVKALTVPWYPTRKVAVSDPVLPAVSVAEKGRCSLQAL